MRHRHLTQYSAAGLGPLPPPITSEVHIALQYANSQVFGRLICKRGSCSSGEKTIITPTTPEPKFRETSTQISGSYTEEKSVMTLPTRESLDYLEKSTIYEEPLHASFLITEAIDAASQVVEKVDIGLQTIDGSMIKSPKKAENGRNDQPTVPETTKSKRKSVKIAKLNADFEAKQRKFEAISAEREAMERTEKEAKEKAEADAHSEMLKQRKEKLLAKHNQYLEKKRIREQQRLQAKKQSSKARNVLPLHERLAQDFIAQESKEDSDFRQELEKVRQRMRRIDAHEISTHAEKYKSTLSSKLDEKSKVREIRQRQITAENISKDYLQSPVLLLDLQERRAEANKQQIEAAKARESLAKQRTYAELAMELHRPKSFVSSGKPSTPKTEKRPSFSVSPLTNHRKRRIRTVRPAVETTYRSPSETSTVKDYNSERRLMLERSVFSSERMSPVFTYQSKNIPETGDVKELRRQAGRLSREAKRGEKVIGRLDKDPELLVKACDNVSAMYLDSIKAKLRIVNSLFV